MFDFLKILKKSSKDIQQSEVVKEALRGKYIVFQQLLSKNNYVLETMADMEEKLSGEYLFDIQYINTKIKELAIGVLYIIENLNTLSNDKYQILYRVFNDINKKIEKTLVYKFEIPVSDLTIPLENITGEMVSIAGGKMAHLGELKNLLSLPAPEGFVISAYAFKKFMEHNRFIEKTNRIISALNIENIEEVNKVSKEIQDMIIQSDVPYDLEEAIKDAYSRLCEKIGKGIMVAVRSSAIREDSDFSFAGQYATFLNIPGDMVVQKYKEVVASLFTSRAIFYSKTKGFSEGEMVMAVGGLNMVDAAAGGVMYTRDPNDPASDHIIINAIYGLGKWVVDGTITPDLYTVSRHPEGTILSKKIMDQERMLVCGHNGTLEEAIVPETKRGKQCLSDKHIKLLAHYAVELEKHYVSPQDIEWAVGSNDHVYILQTRPLKIINIFTPPHVCLPTRIEGYNVILDKGVIACKGVGYGKAFILKNEEDLKNFPERGVLVAKHTNPKYVTVMNKASAIITDVGSATGHMASLSREYQVPTILDTEIATRTIKNGQEITVDAINCNIYEGKVNELIEYALTKKEPFKETRLFKTLEKVLKQIVPLNLIDPENRNFRAENCQTLHDITRFAHEIAMQEMFNIGEGHEIKGTKTVDLLAGIPVAVHLLDIDGGIKDKVKKARPDDILSIPFSALLKGMKSMKWPEPRPVDAKGFLGMIAHASSVPEDQLYQMGEKSFAILSRNYVNFSVRLGYHFSMIEAYAGDNINDNYIKFFFKGGGAAHDRRLRRVRLITEILKKMDFRISVKEDVIDAILTKYKMSTIEEKLDVMGKLTAYTKQLDMVMYNDAVTDMYIQQFIKEHL
ncbi:MAG: PEP/pyruvate-binding domain-containing protein [Nitrospirota bacterium]